MSLAIYVIAVAAVVAVMLGSYFLGHRHHDRAKTAPYESGILASESNQGRFGVHFYLMAMFFVIFDLESVYLVGWAPVAKELGWSGFIHVCIFIGLLLVALIYLWRTGGLTIKHARGKHE